MYWIFFVCLVVGQIFDFECFLVYIYFFFNFCNKLIYYFNINKVNDYRVYVMYKDFYFLKEDIDRKLVQLVNYIYIKIYCVSI